MRFLSVMNMFFLYSVSSADCTYDSNKLLSGHAYSSAPAFMALPIPPSWTKRREGENEGGEGTRKV